MISELYNLVGENKAASVAALILSVAFTIWFVELTNRDAEIIEEIKALHEDTKQQAVSIAEMKGQYGNQEEKFGYILRELSRKE